MGQGPHGPYGSTRAQSRARALPNGQELSQKITHGKSYIFCVFIGVLECAFTYPGNTLQILGPSQFNYHSKNRREILC